MIITKLRLLLACLSLYCLAWNVDACNRVTGWGRLYNYYTHPIAHVFLDGPAKRVMDFYLEFDGEKCRVHEDFGEGAYMMEWSGGSEDGRCFVMVDLKKNQVMVRLDGLIFGGKVIPDVTEDEPNNSYSLYQQIIYDIDFSRNC
ncbi:hypothetical protein BGW39_010906, partial [Mortierella sp. 14UC]